MDLGRVPWPAPSHAHSPFAIVRLSMLLGGMSIKRENEQEAFWKLQGPCNPHSTGITACWDPIRPPAACAGSARDGSSTDSCEAEQSVISFTAVVMGFGRKGFSHLQIQLCANLWNIFRFPFISYSSEEVRPPVLQEILPSFILESVFSELNLPSMNQRHHHKTPFFQSHTSLQEKSWFLCTPVKSTGVSAASTLVSVPSYLSSLDLIIFSLLILLC